MSNPDYPLVSIGMPLYNEVRFVEDSISSILAQDYPNLEIIVSDNSSTDQTFTICQKVIGKQDNVVINRFDTNLGAAENFRYVLRTAKGKYFMWASGHDLWDANLVSECVAMLEEIQTAVIAFGSSVWIDEYGLKLSKYSGYTDTRGLKPVARFLTVLFGNMHPVLGVIRKTALNNARSFSSTVGADLILLTELVLLGDFVHAAGTQWQRREFRHESNHSVKLKRYRSSEYGLSRSVLDKHFPLLRLPLELAFNVLKSDLRMPEKASVLLALMASLPVRYLAGKR